MTASATEDFEIENPVEEAPETIVHFAKCTECGGTVRYRLTSTGHGLIEVERNGFDAEKSFGLSNDGLPECPNGHGIMPLADEQLPTAEAFELAQQKLAEAAGHQPSLPGVVMPFNFQGAYLELEEKAVEVDRLHDEYKAAAEEAKDAKKAWDKAAELYTRMALELRRRRKAKEGEPAEDLLDASEREQTNLVRCTWEEAHPGESCPLCTNTAATLEAPRDSVAHVDEVVAMLDRNAVIEVADALEGFGILVQPQTIQKWSEEDRAAVKTYAESAGTAERPKVLGTGHVAGVGRNGEPQACTQCDQVLIAATEDGSDPNYYKESVLVGTDCQGRAASDGQHYPKRRKLAKRS